MAGHLRTIRRQAPVVALVLVLAACAGIPRSTVAAAPATPRPAPQAPVVAPATTLEGRPNLVVLMTDDMRDDDLRFMPATRRLVGDAGVRFVNSFSPYPLCCPARASVLTGRYAHNHGVLDVTPPYGFPSFDDTSTLATWLDAAGYRTTYIGKYLNGYGYLPEPGATSGTSLTYVPPGWDDWRASIDAGLPWWHRDYGSTYQYFNTTLSDGHGGFTRYQGRYQTRVFGELAARVVRRDAVRGKPFFLHVSFLAPHHGHPAEADDPLLVPQAGADALFQTPARPDDVKGRFDASVTAAPGADWGDADVTDKPAFLRRLPPVTAAERAAMLEVTRQRGEALWVVDRQVRRLVRTLRRTGALDRTVIVFTSDNGYFLGEQRIRQGKVFPHEPSLRVPLLVRGPGIPAGATRHDPAASIDLAPTLAGLAGVRPGHRVDGVSLVDVLRSGDRGWHRGLLTETGPKFSARRTTDVRGRWVTAGSRRDERFAIGVRTHRYLYVDLASGGKELYDLRRDPQQYDNVARAPRYAGVRSRLARVLAALRACEGSGCRAPLPRALRGHP